MREAEPSGEVLYQLHPLPQLHPHHPPEELRPRRSLQRWETLLLVEVAEVVIPLMAMTQTIMISLQVVKSPD